MKHFLVCPFLPEPFIPEDHEELNMTTSDPTSCTGRDWIKEEYNIYSFLLQHGEQDDFNYNYQGDDQQQQQRRCRSTYQVEIDKGEKQGGDGQVNDYGDVPAQEQVNNNDIKSL